MRTITRRLAAAALVLGMAGAVGGCLETAVVMPAGAPVPVNFWLSYLPTYQKGMKWTYMVSGTGSTDPVTMTEEVVSVSGDDATIKTTFMMGTANQEQTEVRGRTQVGKAEAKFVSGGTEDITVPAGTYKAAAKVVSDMNGSKTTFWLARGIGRVKAEIETQKNGATEKTVMELKAFEQ